MREIKFRAWDKTRNIFGEVLEIHRPYGENDSQFPEGHKGRLSLFNIKNEHDCGFWGIWIEKADLEQYTGLKDKNGRDIYEGDVVNAKNVGIGQVVFGNYTICHDDWGVEYETPCFCIAWGDGTGHSTMSPNGLEVIGNIHENPELVGEGKP